MKGKVILRLGKLLAERNMSEEEFCNNAELTKLQFIKYKDNQIQRLNLHTLSKMCHILNCKITDLISYEMVD